MISLETLVRLSAEELSEVDIAERNLACAKGLRGAEHMDAEFCMRQIEKCTTFVGGQTERVLPAFHRNPENFRHSEAYFRVLVMITFLQRDCGINYNPYKMDRRITKYPEDSFIFNHPLNWWDLRLAV